MFFQCFLSLLFLLLFCRANAQSNETLSAASKQEHITKVLLKHYTAAELDDIRTTDSLKYKTLVYYYANSFIIEKFSCTDCVPVNDFSDFDVSKYEKFRKQSERHAIPFAKYGYRLVLLSTDELMYKIPVQQP